MKELFSRDSIVYGGWNPNPSRIFPLVKLRYDKSVPTEIRNAVRLGALEQNISDEQAHIKHIRDKREEIAEWIFKEETLGEEEWATETATMKGLYLNDADNLINLLLGESE